jgi:hypothetical protein
MPKIGIVHRLLWRGVVAVEGIPDACSVEKAAAEGMNVPGRDHPVILLLIGSEVESLPSLFQPQPFL